MKTHDSNDHVRSADLRKPQVIARIGSNAIALIALALLASAASVAAGENKKKDPPALPPLPVTVVSGTVEASVQGVVEVLNDALNEPYVRQAQGGLPDGESISSGAKFDIPDGKRLIVETIAVEIWLPPGQVATADFMLQMSSTSYQAFALIPVQSQGGIGSHTRLIGCQPFKLRKDAIVGSTDEITIRVQRSDYTGGGPVPRCDLRLPGGSLSIHSTLGVRRASSFPAPRGRHCPRE